MLYPVELSDRYVYDLILRNQKNASRHSLPSAERGGFEPPVRFKAYDSLANCWFKPLTHLSGMIFLKIVHFRSKPEKGSANIKDEKKLPKKYG
jgi:hypothetical protein